MTRWSVTADVCNTEAVGWSGTTVPPPGSNPSVFSRQPPIRLHPAEMLETHQPVTLDWCMTVQRR